MMQKYPHHVSFIMDGNGRWAEKKSKPRNFGHKKGLSIILKISKNALKLGIKNISFFAFSNDNFKRPKKEINFLFNLIKKNFNEKYIEDLKNNSISFKWIGFEKELDPEIIKNFKKIETATSKCCALKIYLFFNYSYSLELEWLKNKKKFLTQSIPPIDLLIRTSGEKRISNYCMNLLTYSEIIFEETMWPGYTIKIFKSNLQEFSKRERRYGNVNQNKN